jgi:O-Antigen ligase/Family of unknown function (DUF5935)
VTSATLARGRLDTHAGAAVSAAAIATGVMVGSAMAIDLPVGIALLLGACAAPLVLIDLPLGIAVWAALTALAGLPGLGLAGTAAGILTVCAWLGIPRRERGRLRERVAAPGSIALVLLLAWISLSLAWAEETGTAAGELWHWYVGALIFAVVTTSLRRRRDVRLVIGGLVLGVALSVLAGLVNDGLGGTGDATAETLTSTEGRLQGGLGDPNVLAAAIVPAVVLALALMSVVRGSARLALQACAGVLVIGLAATQSRGGALAAAAAFAAGVLVMKRRRLRVLTAGLGIVLVGTLYLSAYPEALDRVTASDGGSGRADLWRVAARISAQHPVAGVGLHNFTVHSPRNVREPGALDFVELIAEDPHAVHNTYLGLLTETGIVGLGLFLAVAAASLSAAWKAAARFERRREHALATLSRGVLVALVGLLTAAIFVSLGSHPLLWLFLALGPGLLAMGTRRPALGTHFAPRTEPPTRSAGAVATGPRAVSGGVRR